MHIVLLHSAQVEASRAIVEELGGEPAGPDATVVHEGREVRIVSKHALAVGLCPSFSAYPACVVIDDGGDMRVKSPAGSWAECLAFALAPPARGPVFPREFTRLDFLNRFTDQEKVLLKSLESSDPIVALFWEEWRCAEAISLDDPRTVRALDYLVQQGHLTPARRSEAFGLS